MSFCNTICTFFQTYLLSKIAIPDDQIVVINPSLSVEEAAADYAEKLKKVRLGVGVFLFATDGQIFLQGASNLKAKYSGWK